MFKKLFKKKPGGTFFGNILRSQSNRFSGGILGNGKKMIPLEQQSLSTVNSFDGSSVPISLPQLSASAFRNPQPVLNPENSPVFRGLGDVASYLGGRASENTKFGMDNKTMLLVGGGILALILIITQKK